MGAGQIIRLQVSVGTLPQGYQLSTYDQLLQDFAARLIVSPNQAYSTFVYGPIAPTTDQGPWFNTLLNEWWVWDSNIGMYRSERPSSITGEVPIGTIVAWAGKIADISVWFGGAKWQICAGGLLARVTYPSLFQIIGEQYGAGDGLTTFQLPDFRNNFLVGAQQDSGVPLTAMTNVSDGATLTKSRIYKDHKHRYFNVAPNENCASAAGGTAGTTTGAEDMASTLINDIPMRVLPPYFSVPFVIRCL